MLYQNTDCTYSHTVKLLDIFLGCANVIFDKDHTAKVRRALYGTASEHRLPPHGLEYRCLGPYVLQSPKLVELALDLSDYALTPIRRGKEKELLKSIDARKVQAAINTCDVQLAEQVLTEAGLPTKLMERVKHDYGAPDLYKAWAL